MNNYPGFNPNDPANVPPAAPAPASANGWAIASLICGILALVICTCCCGGTGWIPLILGIAAIVLAIVSRKGQKMSGVATGGLVCGIVAAVLALGVLIMGLVLIDQNFMEEFLAELESSMPEDFYQYIE
ncbi:MAG: DUF4190 domain-containing protein [Clostridia bacterium]|nr:DUF4190 domain-containing protein [Clostridia bacterium]